MGEENLNNQHAITGPSNPLLGYGVSGKKSRAPLLAALGIAILLIIGCGALIWNSKVQLPDGTALLAMVPGKAQAPEQFPEAWRNATPGWMPRIWGVAIQQKKPVAFALVPRWTESGNVSANVGLFKLISEEKLEMGQTAKTSELFRGWWKLGWHEAKLTTRFAGKNINGWIENGAWTTDYTLDETLGVADQGDVALDLQAWPESWNQVSRALSEADMPLNLSVQPQSISLFLENGTVKKTIFNFPELTETAKQELSASLGQYALRSMTLPDGEVAEELLYPTTSSTQAGPISATIEGGELKLEGLSQDKTGNQTLVARISPAVLTSAMKQAGFPLEPGCTLRIYRLRQGFMQIICQK